MTHDPKISNFGIILTCTWALQIFNSFSIPRFFQFWAQNAIFTTKIWPFPHYCSRKSNDPKGIGLPYESKNSYSIHLLLIALYSICLNIFTNSHLLFFIFLYLGQTILKSKILILWHKCALFVQFWDTNDSWPKNIKFWYHTNMYVGITNLQLIFDSSFLSILGSKCHFYH